MSKKSDSPPLMQSSNLRHRKYQPSMVYSCNYETGLEFTWDNEGIASQVGTRNTSSPCEIPREHWNRQCLSDCVLLWHRICHRILSSGAVLWVRLALLPFDLLLQALSLHTDRTRPIVWAIWKHQLYQLNRFQLI